LTLHDVKRLKSVQSDATRFDFSSVGPIAFALIDMDLYIPVKDVLPKVFKHMAPGGVVVVDDWPIPIGRGSAGLPGIHGGTTYHP